MKREDLQQLHILVISCSYAVYIDKILTVLIWIFVLFSMKHNNNKQQPNRDRKRGEGGALN